MSQRRLQTNRVRGPPESAIVQINKSAWLAYPKPSFLSVRGYKFAFAASSTASQAQNEPMPGLATSDEDFQIDEYGSIGGIVQPSEAPPAPPSTGDDRIKRLFFNFVQQEPGKTRPECSFPSRSSEKAMRSLRTGQSGRHPISRRPLCLIPTADILLGSGNEKLEKRPAVAKRRAVASREDHSSPAIPGALLASSQKPAKRPALAKRPAIVSHEGKDEVTMMDVVACVMREVRACHRSSSPHLPENASTKPADGSAGRGGGSCCGSLTSTHGGSHSAGSSSSSINAATREPPAQPRMVQRSPSAVASMTGGAEEASRAIVAEVMAQVRSCHHSARPHLGLEARALVDR